MMEAIRKNTLETRSHRYKIIQEKQRTRERSSATKERVEDEERGDARRTKEEEAEEKEPRGQNNGRKLPGEISDGRESRVEGIR